MRFFKKLNAALALALTLTLVSPVALPATPTATVEAATIKINKTKKTLKVGQTYQLKVTGTTKKVTWKSSKKAVATVTSNGKVKAKSVGKTNITATVGNKKFTCKITVKAAENKYVATAPFDAKEQKLDDYTVAVPKDWTVKETEVNGIPAYMLLSGNEEEIAGGGNIIVTITESPTSTQENYEFLKSYLEELLTEELLTTRLNGTGTISDFTQEEVEIHLGKAFKTSYIITVEANGESYSLIQTIYDIFANGYTTEITVTNGIVDTTPDINEVGEYMAASLTYTK